MNKCTGDLLRSWGVDPTLYMQGKMANLNNPARWFSRDSYRQEAKAKRAQGRVILLIKTKSDGSIDECKAVVSADVSLNDGSCAVVLAKVKPTPPRDANGQPIASYAVLNIEWIAPDGVILQM